MPTKDEARAPAARPARARPRRKRKELQLMIRVDEEQKAVIEAFALKHGENVSSGLRQLLLRLAAGWKIVPPDSGTEQSMRNPIA